MRNYKNELVALLLNEEEDLEQISEGFSSFEVGNLGTIYGYTERYKRSIKKRLGIRKDNIKLKNTANRLAGIYANDTYFSEQFGCNGELVRGNKRAFLSFIRKNNYSIKDKLSRKKKRREEKKEILEGYSEYLTSVA